MENELGGTKMSEVIEARNIKLNVDASDWRIPWSNQDSS